MVTIFRLRLSNGGGKGHKTLQESRRHILEVLASAATAGETREVRFDGLDGTLVLEGSNEIALRDCFILHKSCVSVHFEPHQEPAMV